MCSNILQVDVANHNPAEPSSEIYVGGGHMVPDDKDLEDEGFDRLLDRKFFSYSF